MRAGKEIAATREVKCVQTFSKLSQKQLACLPMTTGSQTFDPLPINGRSGSDQHHRSTCAQIWSRWSVLLLCLVCLPVALIGQATLTSPAPGGKLTGSNATFTWTA